jgi:hypothetical protein
MPSLKIRFGKHAGTTATGDDIEQCAIALVKQTGEDVIVGAASGNKFYTLVRMSNDQIALVHNIRDDYSWARAVFDASHWAQSGTTYVVVMTENETHALREAFEAEGGVFPLAADALSMKLYRATEE